MRDDFPESVKRVLAARVRNDCSNPDCRASTSGPQDDPEKALNIGVAAHITGASELGPRYDSSLTPEQRSSINNAIWLCQNCGKLVDNDDSQFPEDLLRAWKTLAECRARYTIGKTLSPPIAAPEPESQRNRRAIAEKLESTLANFMREGKGLKDRIAHLKGEQLAGWDADRESWQEHVVRFLTDSRWHTEVVPFQQAGDNAAPSATLPELRLKQERRRIKIGLQIEKLEQIAHRRIE
jgi:hypothetical protein